MKRLLFATAVALMACQETSADTDGGSGGSCGMVPHEVYPGDVFTADVGAHFQVLHCEPCADGTCASDCHDVTDYYNIVDGALTIDWAGADPEAATWLTVTWFE